MTCGRWGTLAVTAAIWLAPAAAAAQGTASQAGAPQGGTSASGPTQQDTSAKKDDNKPKTVEGTASLSEVQTTGASTTSTFSTANDVTYRPGRPWELHEKVTYTRSAAAGAVNAQSVDGEARLAYRLTRRLATYVRYDYSRTDFSGLPGRQVETAGLELKILSKAPQELSIAAGAGYSNHSGLKGASSAVTMVSVNYKWTITPTANLTHEANLQFPIGDQRFERTDFTTGLNIGITKVFTLSLQQLTRWLPKAPPQVKNLSTTTTTTVSIKF